MTLSGSPNFKLKTQTTNAMNDRDIWTCDAMEKFGGSFVQHLGALARRADLVNLEKIKATWPEYWEDYEQRGITMQQTEQA